MIRRNARRIEMAIAANPLQERAAVRDSGNRLPYTADPPPFDVASLTGRRLAEIARLDNVIAHAESDLAALKARRAALYDFLPAHLTTTGASHGTR